MSQPLDPALRETLERLPDEARQLGKLILGYRLSWGWVYETVFPVGCILFGAAALSAAFFFSKPMFGAQKNPDEGWYLFVIIGGLLCLLGVGEFVWVRLTKDCCILVFEKGISWLPAFKWYTQKWEDAEILWEFKGKRSGYY